MSSLQSFESEFKRVSVCMEEVAESDSGTE